MLYLALPRTCSVTLPKSLSLSMDWRLLVTPDPTQESRKSALKSSYRQGEVLSLLLLLFMSNTAAAHEDLRSPHGFLLWPPEPEISF